MSPFHSQFDVVVVGAGVVGCAVARELSIQGAKVLVLERAPDILDGASKGNSAILHTGFDAPVGTLEQACVAQGHAQYLKIHTRLGLPLVRSGALVLARTETELARLPALLEQSVQTGVHPELLSKAQILALEPGLANAVLGGFRIAEEFLIDPWSAPLAYLLQAMAHGAQVWRSCALQGGHREREIWHLQTQRGEVRSRVLVNAAGLQGDRVDEITLGQRSFSIRPRKGQFLVFDKSCYDLAQHILLPVPTETTKGVVICRTVFGNLLVGPTAEEQTDRDHASLDPQTLRQLHAQGAARLPALADQQPPATYAGLRPATEEKAYRYFERAEQRQITLGGIRSTGLSAALGLATHVAHRLRDWGELSAEPKEAHTWPTVPNLAESLPRDWQAAGHGGFVCHCERVTRREVSAALQGPLPATTMAGLKRRTRVTMGRCQGFYCASQAEACLREHAAHGDPNPVQPSGDPGAAG